MRCDRIPHSRLMYETAAVLSVWTSTCLPNSIGRNCRKAKCTAHSFRQLMCQSSRGPVQSPVAACPLHVFLWAQVHRDRSLHPGNARVPPGHSAFEGSEDGGGGQGASGRERGHPRLRQLLLHLREERPGPQGAVVSSAPLRETNRPATRARNWAVY